MKKITLLFMAAALALSCWDDDNAPVSLDGTWKLTNINLNRERYDLNNDGVISENFIEESSCLGESTLSFTETGTAIFSIADRGDGQSRTAMDTPTPPCLMKTPETVTYTSNVNSIEFTYTSISSLPGGELKRTFIRSGNKLTTTLDFDGTEEYIPGSGEYADANFYSYATFEFTKQ